MRDDRGHWYLLTGFAIGIILGLVYAWLVSPQQYQDNSPASLQPEFKDQYRAMIAAAFVSSGHLARAEQRLALLDDEDVVRALAEQAQRTLAEGSSPVEAQALGLLAVALGQGDSPFIPTSIANETAAPGVGTNAPQITSTAAITPETNLESTTESVSLDPSPLPTNQTPQATRTVLSAATPLPTRTATPTPGTPFVLQDNSLDCDPDILGPLIQVIAETSSGRPIPNQEVLVTWEGGEDYFYTGLKPELGAGYADFMMTPGVIYEVRMSAGGQIVQEITPAECETESGQRYWGSWLLVFSRP